MPGKDKVPRNLESWPYDQLIDFLIDRAFPGVGQQELNDYQDNLELGINPPGDDIVSDVSDVRFRHELFFARNSDGLVDMCKRAVEKFPRATAATLKEHQMFYNRKESDPGFHGYHQTPKNWEGWLARDYWSEDEAIALSMGKTPDRVNWAAVKGYLAESSFVKEYAARRKVVKIDLRKGILKTPIIPTEFIKWCTQKEWDIPPECTTALQETETAAAENSKIASTYWGGFERKTVRAIREYPDWRDQQRRVQKTGTLVHWLTGTIKVSHREAEIIKKVLADIYPELR